MATSLIKNKIKRYIPSWLSCLYKESIVDNYLQRIPPTITDEFSKKHYFLYDACFIPDLSATRGRKPKLLYWDRYNDLLSNHFYTDDLIFNNKWKPDLKFAITMEPYSLQPKKYKTLLRDRFFCNEFKYIFTSNNDILMNIPNAKPLINGGVYIGTPFGFGDISIDQYMNKNKNVSIVSSNKVLCELHRFRLQLAKYYENKSEVDCFGTFNRAKPVKIADSLMEYRYSIVIENDIQDYWITEKICNCFASMTVPIYLGSHKIGDFFNIDGIITIDKKDIGSVENIVKSCCKEDYEERIPAIIDNFNRVKKYYCMEDWLISEYNTILP